MSAHVLKGRSDRLKQHEMSVGHLMSQILAKNDKVSKTKDLCAIECYVLDHSLSDVHSRQLKQHPKWIALNNSMLRNIKM